jgi:hypothetical protein
MQAGKDVEDNTRIMPGIFMKLIAPFMPFSSIVNRVRLSSVATIT